MDRSKTSNPTELNVVDDMDSSDFGENYEPHDHKPPGESTSYCETLSLLAKACVGTGIFGMPRAFSNAGYILGIAGTILAGIATKTSMHLIAESEHELCKRKRIPRMTYPETAEAAFELGPRSLRKFKKIARIACSAFLLMNESGSFCAHLIFGVENIKAICDHLVYPASLRFHLLLLLGPFILLCWIKNLKHLAPGATMGSGCALVCIGAVYVFIFSQPITLEGRKEIGSLRPVALSFGTIVFALGAFGEYMPIKNRMTEPAKFASTCGVVNVLMIPFTVLYVIMGFFGYLAFGENTRNPINMNMPETGVMGYLIRALLTGSLFMSCLINNYVVIEELWHKNLKLKLEGRKHVGQWEYAFRTVVTCACFLCCIAIPNLELVTALVGSLVMPVLGMWLPVIISSLTFWKKYTGFQFTLFIFKNVALLLTGVFALVSVLVTVLEIYESVLK
ncbi:proton-coupled amino acid transporter-like protein acs isoform X2 [Bemisia tabaci]